MLPRESRTLGTSTREAKGFACAPDQLQPKLHHHPILTLPLLRAAAAADPNPKPTFNFNPSLNTAANRHPAFNSTPTVARSRRIN